MSDKEFKTFEEIMEYVESRARQFKPKKAYYCTEEYKELYPKIVKLRENFVRNQAESVKKAMEEVGLKVGDKVENVQYNPWGMEFVREGKIVLDKEGVPRVKLTRNDIDGKKKVRWHKGFKKIAYV